MNYNYIDVWYNQGEWAEGMNYQQSFTDLEYANRKKKTKREEFLEAMDYLIPWDEWVVLVEPYYPSGKRGRPTRGIETMLRMYFLAVMFNLSDEGVEDAMMKSHIFLSDYPPYYKRRDYCVLQKMRQTHA